MILIDSNVPMYLVGADEQMRLAAGSAVRSAQAAGWRMVTDAEVYEEVLHRYVAIGRRDAIEPCVALLDRLVSRVYPIDREVIVRAIDTLESITQLSARDAIHAGVAGHYGILRILSFDRGFDAVPGLSRFPAE
ncbi:MAG: type II toxin-antitoxin system VapC family toxin [Actinomycetota bacterium]